ncbi:MAG: TonB-dependent receptor, partial [Acidobacteriota bacterium]|nr:TonB-dependent receptor [Acidobacteriota bacterium]
DTVPTWTQLGSNVYQGVPGYLFLSINGYFQPQCTNCSPGPWISTNYQLSEELSLIRGAHQISVGVNATNSRLNSFSNFQRNGNFSFSGVNTGNAMTDFLMGLPSSFTQNNGQIGDERLTQPSLYVQDNIRVLSHLTLNVGLRWDPYEAPGKAVPQVSIFDPGWYASGTQSKVFSRAPAGTLFAGDQGMPGNHYFYGRTAEFAPRLGVVYDPRGKGTETIRAGYGIFYGGTPLWQQAGIFAPFTAPVSIPNPSGGLSDPFKGAVVTNPYPEPNPLPSDVAFPLFGTGLGNFKLHPKPTYMEQWNLALQKQFGEWLVSVTYMGNRTVHLEYGEPYNPSLFIAGNCAAGQYGLTAAGACSNTGNLNYRRMMYLSNPAKAQYYAGVTAFGDGANANYNGLLISVQHRFAHNFTVLANDTWSHCLTESEVALNGAAGGQDPFNRAAEYGNCLSGRQQVFNLSAVVRSPKFAAPWMNRLAGGWQESTIFTDMTGSYSTVNVGTDNSRTGNGADRPNVVGAIGVSNPSIGRWFNTSAFQAGPVGTFGNAGRDIVLGPGAWNFDVSVSRSFNLTERYRIDFRAEAFNLLNHARFGNPGTTLNTPSFGVITTAMDPRIMQFALKFAF